MTMSDDRGHGPTQVIHVSVTFGEDGRPLGLLHALSEDGVHVVCAAYSLHPDHGDDEEDGVEPAGGKHREKTLLAGCRRSYGRARHVCDR